MRRRQARCAAAHFSSLPAVVSTRAPKALRELNGRRADAAGAAVNQDRSRRPSSWPRSKHVGPHGEERLGNARPPRSSTGRCGIGRHCSCGALQRARRSRRRPAARRPDRRPDQPTHVRDRQRRSSRRPRGRGCRRRPEAADTCPAAACTSGRLTPAAATSISISPARRRPGPAARRAAGPRARPGVVISTAFIVPSVPTAGAATTAAP